MGDLRDVELINRLLEREDDALREVIDTYGGVVLGMARKVVADRTLAEEVAQDAFVALWRRPGAFDPSRGSLQSFLIGIARNKAIDLVRREESLRRRADELASEMDRTVHPSALDQVETRHEVHKALAALTPPQREAITLAYLGGRTYREVAQELQIPEGTAKTRLRDGLTKLRQMMETKS